MQDHKIELVQPSGQVCTDFAQGLPPGSTAEGPTPPYVADGVLHLTDATNDQAGYWDTRTAVLQSAPTVGGPWTNVAEGTNEVWMINGGGSEFFRVQVP